MPRTHLDSRSLTRSHCRALATLSGLVAAALTSAAIATCLPREGATDSESGAPTANAAVAAAAPPPAPAVRPIAPPVASATPDAPGESRPIAAPAGSFGGDALRTGGALVGVLALILIMRTVLRRVGDPLAARRPSGVVQVLARFPLAKGQQVMLLEVGRRVLCVHQSATGAATLCSFDDASEIADLKARVESGSTERQRFERQLARSLERDGGERSQARAPARAGLLEEPETIDLTRRARRMSRFGARA